MDSDHHFKLLQRPLPVPTASKNTQVVIGFSSRRRPSARLPDRDRRVVGCPPMPLTVEESLRAVASAQAHAQKIGIRVCVAVVDEGGYLVALSRMDGGAPISAQIAEAKASGTGGTLRDGQRMGELYRERPGFVAFVTQLTRVPAGPSRSSRLVEAE